MYTYPVTVEFEDIDSYSIAHHTKLIAYLERARVHFVIDSGIDIKNIDFGMVVVNLNINFKRPLTMLDNAIVEVRVKEIGEIRFTWDYRIKKNGILMVKAEMEQVVISNKTNKMIKIPDNVKNILEKILIKNE